MKIGLFGGTFNPVHLGHLRAAEEIREKFSLSKVFFIPAHVPPHKAHSVAPAQDRFAMVRAAVADNPFFDVSDIELQRHGKSYSVDTIRHFRAEHGSGAELFFIMGSDAFREIQTWRSYPEFFGLCSFIVMSRPGESAEPGKSVPHEFADLFAQSCDGNCYEHLDSGNRVYFCRVSLLDISSTGIRQALGLGGSVKYLVPDSVAGYILKYGIY